MGKDFEKGIVEMDREKGKRVKKKIRMPNKLAKWRGK